MLLARFYFETPEDFWRSWLVCVDGVAPFVSYCAVHLAPWWYGR